MTLFLSFELEPVLAHCVLSENVHGDGDGGEQEDEGGELKAVEVQVGGGTRIESERPIVIMVSIGHKTSHLQTLNTWEGKTVNSGRSSRKAVSLCSCSLCTVVSRPD